MKDDNEQPPQDTRDVDDDRSRTEVARRVMEEYSDEMRAILRKLRRILIN
jgi:hypothetical protein